MIMFTEREPFKTREAFTSSQTLIPVFMENDGVEYFVANLPIAGGNYSPEYHREEMEGYKAQLIKNEGRYFKFHGFYDSPEEMIEEISEKGHTFTEPDNLFMNCTSSCYGAGFVDFHGNRRELSASFYYRIYDSSMVESLKKSLLERGLMS